MRDAFAALRNPDQSRYAATQGAWVYYRTFGNTKIEVVAKQNERKEWVVLSVWSKSVYESFPGEKKELPSIWSLIWKRIRKNRQ